MMTLSLPFPFLSFPLTFAFKQTNKIKVNSKLVKYLLAYINLIFCGPAPPRGCNSVTALSWTGIACQLSHVIYRQVKYFGEAAYSLETCIVLLLKYNRLVTAVMTGWMGHQPLSTAL